MSTLSVALSDEGLEEIRELAIEFRQRVLLAAKSCENPNNIYQVNIQMFPLSQ